MMKLYFMDREFSGHCWSLCERLEDEAFCKSIGFEEEWYFLRYEFFGKDCVCSETSAALQTHLYNMVSILYRDFESLREESREMSEHHSSIVQELVEVCEYSTRFPVCLWAFGDETTREFLNEWLDQMPSAEQMAHVLKLPHMARHEQHRLPYRHSEPTMALKRFRNELAAFNRRQKIVAKNAQRSLE